MGVARALERLVAALRVRGTSEVRFDVTTTRLPPADMEIAIFLMVKEALANAVKHAQATEGTVTIAEEDGMLVVTVADNGVGFAVEAGAPAAGGGLGLRSMRERAAAAGIILEIASSPGAGTTIRASAPL